MRDDDGPSPPSAAEDGSPFPSTDGAEDETAPSGADGRGSSPGGPIRALLDADGGPLMYLREALVSVAVVGLVGLLLFALSGVWPPMVAVESGSMEPHMHRGDLVFVSEPGRYVPETGPEGPGVVTRAEGEQRGYRTFGAYGSVIVYDSPARGGPPVIHRAHFWVAEGENWFDAADRSYHHADSCRELPNCPAPHAGFITKGDANGQYDQVNGISASGPVRPSWIAGVAHVRVPYLGHVRLWLAEGGVPVGTIAGQSSAFVHPSASSSTRSSGVGFASSRPALYR